MAPVTRDTAGTSTGQAAVIEQNTKGVLAVDDSNMEATVGIMGRDIVTVPVVLSEPNQLSVRAQNTVALSSRLSGNERPTSWIHSTSSTATESYRNRYCTNSLDVQGLSSSPTVKSSPSVFNLPSDDGRQGGLVYNVDTGRPQGQTQESSQLEHDTISLAMRSISAADNDRLGSAFSSSSGEPTSAVPAQQSDQAEVTLVTPPCKFVRSTTYD